MQPRTLFDKLWDAHVVHVEPDGTALIYIDRQLVHEVTSPQAFEGLKINGRKPWRLASLLATPDHNIPTADRDKGIADPVSRTQVETLDANCAEFGVRLHPRQVRGVVQHRGQATANVAVRPVTRAPGSDRFVHLAHVDPGEEQLALHIPRGGRTPLGLSPQRPGGGLHLSVVAGRPDHRAAGPRGRG